MHKYLSHHYILKRSFVFIVDPYFRSSAKMEQASKYINKFFNSLPKTDNFGLISLQLSSRANELILEEKGKNPHLKELFLRSMFDERTHF